MALTADETGVVPHANGADQKIAEAGQIRAQSGRTWYWCLTADTATEGVAWEAIITLDPVSITIPAGKAFRARMPYGNDLTVLCENPVI